MKHTTVPEWQPRLLAELDLFEHAGPCAEVLADAPVVLLDAGETLQEARSGERLALVALSGTLRTQADGGMVTLHGGGALLGLRHMLHGSGDAAAIQAETDSTVLLLDRRRVLRLAEHAPAFARRIVLDLVAPPPGAAADVAASTRRQPLDAADRFPASVGHAVLVRLINHDALACRHGDAAASEAMQALGRAVEQSIRPGDVLVPLGRGEYLIGVEGDMLAATIVARRLVSRAARTVVFGDMRTGLPHLEVATGIAASLAEEPVAAAATRAREDAEAGAASGGVCTA